MRAPAGLAWLPATSTWRQRRRAPPGAGVRRRAELRAEFREHAKTLAWSHRRISDSPRGARRHPKRRSVPTASESPRGDVRAYHAHKLFPFNHMRMFILVSVRSACAPRSAKHMCIAPHAQRHLGTKPLLRPRPSARVYICHHCHLPSVGRVVVALDAPRAILRPYARRSFERGDRVALAGYQLQGCIGNNSNVVWVNGPAGSTLSSYESKDGDS